MPDGRHPLSVAIGDYFHVRHLVDGRVGIPGLDVAWVQIQNEDILQRSFRFREWDASEFSLAQYVALRSRGDTSLTAIPVFPSRVFRHGSVFVRDDSRLEPGELSASRIGVPEWVQTAGVWTRGILAEDYALDIRSVNWVQGGLVTPGRKEHIVITPPEGVRIDVEGDRSLTELLAAGELDAIISARAPAAGDGNPIRRLFTDARQQERAWGLRNQIVPIMHVVVLRTDRYERSPWIARALYDGFEEARRRAVSALGDLTTSVVPIPWAGEFLSELAGLFSGPWWSYGLHANRDTIDRFLCYCRRQGIATPDITAESLFASETLEDTVI